ncbi:MAG: UDP-glucose 4-epimerase GalE [Alphaproteobacteria bacterium]|jgi:UDP-glucose 4-epimerase|nr:UDP-glucose 4-epimerase GalE [Alphaproteobacteria bacterium]
MRILLIGGAGYIGSAIAHHLVDRGHEPAVFDNLSTGSRDAIPAHVPFVQGDCGDSDALAKALVSTRAEGVIQLAAAVRVEESVADPAKYYFNNTVKSLTVFDTCARNGVKDFVFSSTAAVYGAPAKTLIAEDTATEPVNPYGHSKLASEFMLKDIARVHGMRATIFRYFNVAGADPQLRTGQRTPEATHLIKVAAEVATGARPSLDIFGTDYPTPDGTCVRDYIHVMDLALAHELALTKPGTAGETRTYNCGYGTGHSVRQVVDAFGKVLNHPLPSRDRPRRPGDPPALVCDSAKLKRELGWAPQHASIATIVETALNWERKLNAARRG